MENDIRHRMLTTLHLTTVKIVLLCAYDLLQDAVKTQEGPRQEGHHRKEAENNEEENYEEEDEEVEKDAAGRDKGTNRRAEM